jgi:hypothetical protein
VILVDTSVWVDHFRVADDRLSEMLLDGHVLCHPLVVGELACGHLRRRAEILALLNELPGLPVVLDEELMTFIDVHLWRPEGLGGSTSTCSRRRSRHGKASGRKTVGSPKPPGDCLFQPPDPNSVPRCLGASVS